MKPAYCHSACDACLSLPCPVPPLLFAEEHKKVVLVKEKKEEKKGEWRMCQALVIPYGMACCLLPGPVHLVVAFLLVESLASPMRGCPLQLKGFGLFDKPCMSRGPDKARPAKLYERVALVRAPNTPQIAVTCCDVLCNFLAACWPS